MKKDFEYEMNKRREFEMKYLSEVEERENSIKELNEKLLRI